MAYCPNLYTFQQQQGKIVKSKSYPLIKEEAKNTQNINTDSDLHSQT